MYLGIDIGTSGVKASLVDRAGAIAASARRKFRFHGLEQDHRELSPAEMAAGLTEAVGEVVAAHGSGAFDLVLVSSLGEAVIPVDATGRPLGNCIVGSDKRGGEEMAWLCERIPPARLADITGLNPSNIYSLNKILHLKRHQPALYAKARKFFCVTDYFVHLLTGEAVIDYSMASRTMAFDINAKEWSREILALADVAPDLFSTPALAGTVAGEVTAAFAAASGLATGTPVAIGTHDHICNAIGVGAVNAGDCSNAVGTTEGITAILADRLASGLVVRYNISSEPFVLADRYNTVAWHNTAGALVNWYLDLFYGGERTAAQTAAILARLNDASPRAPGKLMAVPHFSGSTTRHMDDKAKGGILGLTLGSDRADIFRALIEGACFECKLILDALAKSAIPVTKLFVSGGGSHSRLWLETKADVLGMALTVGEVADSGALGAGILAAVVCGHYGSLGEAAAALVKGGRVVEPHPGNIEIYNRRYQEYVELYDRLKNVNHILP